MKFKDTTIENFTVVESQRSKLSLDNPSLDALRASYPDLKIYGPEGNIPKTLYRIVTEDGGWMEHHEAVEVQGLGVMVREFDIYDRGNTLSKNFIYGARLEDVAGGFVKIVRDDDAIAGMIGIILNAYEGRKNERGSM